MNLIDEIENRIKSESKYLDNWRKYNIYLKYNDKIFKFKNILIANLENVKNFSRFLRLAYPDLLFYVKMI